MHEKKPLHNSFFHNLKTSRSIVWTIYHLPLHMAELAHQSRITLIVTLYYRGTVDLTISLLSSRIISRKISWIMSQIMFIHPIAVVSSKIMFHNWPSHHSPGKHCHWRSPFFSEELSPWLPSSLSSWSSSLSHLHRTRYDCELAPEHIADLAVGQNIHHLFEQVLDTF